MRIHFILFLLLLSLGIGCGNSEPVSPVKTLKAYSIAVKRKDVAMMKNLLSQATLQNHADQAKVLGNSIDEIILRETIFPESQRVFDYRNEKILGDKATVEVKNSFDGWDMVYLVREKGLWKIDKKEFVDQIINQSDEAERKFDEQLDRDRQVPVQENEGNSNSAPAATPNDNSPIPIDPNVPPDQSRDLPEDSSSPSKLTDKSN